jgi:hypothetical protein
VVVAERFSAEAGGAAAAAEGEEVAADAVGGVVGGLLFAVRGVHGKSPFFVKFCEDCGYEAFRTVWEWNAG